MYLREIWRVRTFERGSPMTHYGKNLTHQAFLQDPGYIAGLRLCSLNRGLNLQEETSLWCKQVNQVQNSGNNHRWWVAVCIFRAWREGHKALWPSWVESGTKMQWRHNSNKQSRLSCTKHCGQLKCNEGIIATSKALGCTRRFGQLKCNDYSRVISVSQ